MNRKNVLLAWFLLFCICEFALIGYARSFFGVYISPIVFTIVSFIIGAACFYFAREKRLLQKPTNVAHKDGLKVLYLVIPFGIFLIINGYMVFSKIPIDYNHSDVFAQVIEPSKWILKGEYPYQDVILPTYKMHNTYLPMQWLPFTLSSGLGFDPRWIPVTFWVIALLIFLKKFEFSLSKKHLILGILITSIAFFSVIGYMNTNEQEYSSTLELLPSAYYILLIASLLRGSWFWIGVSLAFCFLSRFSIVFLSPFLAWYVYHQYGKIVITKSIIALVATVSLLFIVPFVSQDPTLPQKIVANYDNGAAGEWSIQKWQAENDLPYQLSRGLGIALFIRNFYEDNIPEGVKSLKRLGFAITMLLSLFFLSYFYLKQSSWDMNWVLLGSIKVYFTVFYFLVLIPYTYLHIVPITITVLILLLRLREYALSE
ncbi:MAG: glycosyltransferase family 39 protein [Saprospiraceae bacterium]|nr:glycosyltransferase family 39 protein [Saprospiraceae bacterium]